ncbi:MAG: hypothetical protein PHO18_02300 [Synergistaceae bacterium]|nr:hypothetical protein [Synergistaceae bacterium]
MKIKKIAASVLIVCSMFTAAPLAYAGIGDILKEGALIFGGGALVKAIGPQLNDFINTITFNKGVRFDGYTKVVPIVSIGNGTRIGAAQVGGVTKTAVDRVKAVGQIEGEFNSIRAQALIPIDSENPLKQFKRVQGVGVTAIIDVKL